MGCILYMSTSREAQVIFTKFFHLRSFFCTCLHLCHVSSSYKGSAWKGRGQWESLGETLRCSQLLLWSQQPVAHRPPASASKLLHDLLKLLYGFAKVTKWICKTFLALSCCCFGASSQLPRVPPQCFSVKEVTCISQSCCMYLQSAAAALELALLVAVSCYVLGPAVKRDNQTPPRSFSKSENYQQTPTFQLQNFAASRSGAISASVRDYVTSLL